MKDCVRLEGRNVPAQAEDRAKIRETIVLLRLERRLQLASEVSLQVGVAHGS